jgi:hypothetical protein
MTRKSLKKFTVLLNRNEGIAIVPIIVIMILMSIMGGIFTHTMGVWKISAPLTINGEKAYYLAEVAAKRALQDANYRFFNRNDSDAFDFPDGPTSATRATPYTVLFNDTETAEYWIERPYVSSNDDVDTYLGVNRGDNDDDTTSVDDDIVDDDGDDGTSKASAEDKRRYTIIATGKVKRDGTTVAKKQIKVKASIVRSGWGVIAEKVYTEGIIDGDGDAKDPEFHVKKGSKNTSYADGDNVNVPTPTAESELVDRTGLPVLDEYMFKALSTSQGHNQSGTWNVTDGYPNGSFFYSTEMPNVIYVDGNLSATGSAKLIWGIYYVTGWVDLNSTALVEGIIICDGNITLNGGTGYRIHGGLFQYGTASRLTGNGNDCTIDLGSNSYYEYLDWTMPAITIKSWHETRSAH